MPEADKGRKDIIGCSKWFKKMVQRKHGMNVIVIGYI